MEQVLVTVPSSLMTVAECEEFQGTFSLDVLKAGPDLYSFEAPLEWNVTISNTGEALLVMGTVEALARTTCARCLDPFSLTLFGEVEAFFLFKSECALAAELEEDEYEILPESGIIDLTPYLLAALRLELPFIPLCDDTCLGLCDQCGVNLNKGQCDCVREEDDVVPVGANNPFSALKDLNFNA